LVGLVVEYKKEKMDKEEHHLRGSMTSEGEVKDLFFHFCKKKGRRETLAERFKRYQ
jgi:hypothetical protein